MKKPEYKPPIQSPIDKTRKPTKHKAEKIWILEYKWKSRTDYNTFHAHGFWGRGAYTDKWKTNVFGSKFATLMGAIDSQKSIKKTHYWDELSGKYWRVRNIKTNEIYEIPNRN